MARPGHYVSFTFRYFRLVADLARLYTGIIHTYLHAAHALACTDACVCALPSPRDDRLYHATRNTRTGRGFKPICNRERLIYIPLFCQREKCVDTDLFITLERRRWSTLEFKTTAFSIWSEFFGIYSKREKQWRNLCVIN